MSLFNQRIYSNVAVPQSLINYHFNLQRQNVESSLKLKSDVNDVVGQPVFNLDSSLERFGHLVSRPSFRLSRFFAETDQKDQDRPRTGEGSEPGLGGGRRRDTGVDHPGGSRPPVRHDIDHGGGSSGSDGFGGGGRNEPI